MNVAMLQSQQQQYTLAPCTNTTQKLLTTLLTH